MLRMAPIFLIAAALALAGCGSSQSSATSVTPFTSDDARYFEDGVDFVMDPEALGGQWYEGWNAEIDARVTRADLVALVTVHTVRTDIDLDRRTTYRLVARVDRTLLGAAPSDDLTLRVREDQGGFESVRGNEERIMNQSFVAYIKWYETPEGERLPHWHLAPASDAVRARTASLLEQRRNVQVADETRRRVIVHEQ